MTEPEKPIDWAGIEADFRNGRDSIREIARWYSVSEKAIRKRAKAGEWVRTHPQHGPHQKPTADQRPPSPAEPVMMAGVDATKPENIVSKGQNLILRLLDELDAATSHHGELAEMIQAHEEDPRRQAAMMKAIELPGRANVIRALATAFKTWTEAQAPDGKKAQRQAAAKDVATGGGKFAPGAPPKLVVDNR